MFRFIVVSVSAGLIFAMLDGVVNANPLVRKPDHL
jgi:hypothetical protein